MPRIDPKNTQVILIGTSEINDENFFPIPNVINNLGELQGLLFTVVGIDKSHIHPFFDKDNDSEINRKVIEIVPKATNTVIVYYAGHCVRHHQALYLTTKGTQSRDPKNTGAIVAGDLLQTVIDKSKPNTNIIFILDCCLSGLAGKYIDDKERKVFLITATSSNETAKDESPKDENLTAFTETLLSILKEGIDFAGKNLTIQDIFTGLKQKLVSQNLPKPKMALYGSFDKLEICENRAFKNSSRTANNKRVRVYDMVQKHFLLAVFVVLICVIAIYIRWKPPEPPDISPPQITGNEDEGKKTPSTKSEKPENESGSHIEKSPFLKENKLSEELPLRFSKITTKDGKKIIELVETDLEQTDIVSNKTWMVNEGEKWLRLSIDSFPYRFFYTDLFNHGFVKLNPEEEKKFTVSLLMDKKPDALEYSFTIKDQYKRSLPMMIKVKVDLKGLHSTVAKEFNQQILERYDSISEIHDAVVRIVAKAYPKIEPYIQQIVAGQVLSSQRYFKAATMAYQKAEELNPYVSNNPSFKLMVESARDKGEPLKTTFTGKVFHDRLKDGSLGPEMVQIPAGTFQMGDIQGGGGSDEQPVHSVSVNEFAMGRYEITFAEYDQFAQATGRREPNDQGWGRGDRPVMNVSWDDATAYAEWLSEETGQTYRLPTEAEWEYAARAGSNTKYWWGNEIGSNRANCMKSECGDNFKYTAPVGSFAPNQFGLYDTVGNVWEWTCSEYENRYGGKEQSCLSNNRAKIENKAVLRGGSWVNDARRSRSTIRGRWSRTVRIRNYGFRLVRLL